MEMSQSPWPSDLLAVSRMDWCRPSQAGPEYGEGSAVSRFLCSAQARQCGSFQNNTRDREAASHAAPLIHKLLEAPEITEWSGTCPLHMKVDGGVCGLGGFRRSGYDIWSEFGEARERQIYKEIARGGRKEKQNKETSDAVNLLDDKE